MATRTITGTIYHPGTNTAWSGAVVTFRLAAPFTAGQVTYPTETRTATTDVNGTFSVTLAVPDSGTAPYQITLPDGASFLVYLASGAATDLATLLASTGSAIAQSAIQSAVDAHAADTTNVHGIVDTSALVLTTDSRLLRIPETIPIRAAYSTQAWTSMPLALTEFNSNTQGRIKVDLTNATQARLIVHTMSTVGAAGSELRVQYSTDESVWSYLDGATGPAVPITSANATIVSAWVNLVVGAKADIFIRVVGINGDGVISPTFGNIVVQVR